MKNEIKKYREYLIENIRINRVQFNHLNNADWEEEGYSSEEEMESFCSRYGGITHALECALETFDTMFDIDDTEDRLSFANVEDAYDYYWDQSRNPNGNWETEQALDLGEVGFCIMMGFKVDDWMECRNRKNK